MRVFHNAGATIVQGTVAEQAKIKRWIELANCQIIVDECDDDETSFTVVSRSWHTTQKERQEDFQFAKKKLK
jgi:hypothetical protein